MDKETLKQVRRILKQPHRKDLEGYYGALTGNGLSRYKTLKSSFNLIRLHVDEADIESNEKGTRVYLKRKR